VKLDSPATPERVFIALRKARAAERTAVTQEAGKL